MGKGATLALKITGDASDGKRALDEMESRGGRLGGIMGKVGLGIAGGLAAGTAAFVGLYEAADESRKIGALTEQVIKSTGGAAKITADQVGDLAGAIAKKTGVDDEAIQSGANLLLTFTNVKNGVGAGNDIFNQATKIMTDMSVALGTDASGSAIQLGKALNDPVKGVTALSKVGVSFTEDQKKQIKTLVDSGNTMAAQKVILNELGKEFGGAAEAAATPLDKLKQRAGDVAEKLGGFLLPLVDKGAAFLGDKLVPAVSSLAEKLGPVLLPVVQQVGGFITNTLVPAVSSLWQELGPRLVPIIRDVAGFVTGVLVPAFLAVWSFVSSYVVPIFKSILGPALDGLSSFFGKLKNAVNDNKDKFVEIYEKVKPFLEFVRDKVAPFIGGAFKVAFEVLGAAIGPVVNTISWILDKAGAVVGFFGKVGNFLFGGGGGGASRPAGRGAVRGAARGAGSLFTSGSTGAVGVGPAGGAGGLTPVGDTYYITVSGALDPVAVADQIGALLDQRARRLGTRPAFSLS